MFSYRDDVLNSFFFRDIPPKCGPEHYGVEMIGGVSAVLIQNNIFDQICAPIIIGPRGKRLGDIL